MVGSFENYALALEVHAFDGGGLAPCTTSVSVMRELDAPIRIGLAGGVPRRHARNLAVVKFDHTSRRCGHGRVLSTTRAAASPSLRQASPASRSATRAKIQSSTSASTQPTDAVPPSLMGRGKSPELTSE